MGINLKQLEKIISEETKEIDNHDILINQIIKSIKEKEHKKS